MNLYWLTTEDHDEDWFVIANNEKDAATFHEEEEGYEVGYAKAEWILELPEEIQIETGWPTNKILIACGAEFVSDSPRVVKIGNRTFCEGMLESIILEQDDDKFEARGDERLNKTNRSTKQ
jgi:hypothetical protein